MIHSQRFREKPLLPWVICELDGKVLAGHCNCMAGLGESCSHVASLLWAIEAGVRLRDSMTVTQKKAYWVLPPSIKDVPYAPIAHIKLQGKSAALSTWRAFRMSSTSTLSPSPSTSRSPSPATSHSLSPAPRDASSNCHSPPLTGFDRKKVKPPTCEELDGLYLSLSRCKSKPAVLALISKYSSEYIPKALHPDYLRFFPPFSRKNI